MSSTHVTLLPLSLPPVNMLQCRGIGGGIGSNDDFTTSSSNLFQQRQGKRKKMKAKSNLHFIERL